MESFVWNPCFVTGLADIDAQHHQLVNVINRFGDLIMGQDGAPIEAIEQVFEELAQYAQYHFAEEEALMLAQSLDPRYIAQHKQSHASFFDEVQYLHGGITVHSRDSARSLMQFLTQWLAYHILGTDQFMAKQIAAIEAGARPEDAYLDEVVTKDPAMDALLAALNGLFHQVSQRNHALMQLNRNLEERVAQRTQALTEANRRLDDLANTDILTGLANRRCALRRFAADWDQSVIEGSPLSCIMIDADGFKPINDRYGHDAGDMVLRALAAQLKNTVRTDDMLCRLGGDEFLVICANTPLEGALILAESMRQSVSLLRVKVGQGEWQGSVSMGVACRLQTMPALEFLMKAADQGLYAAKKNGRNCVATS
jgi:diguanylate cyclase (GGDEF)-like protein/hemerythrin-like metal-binding protein